MTAPSVSHYLAIHEAGHAVMARALGVRITHIEFYPGREPAATTYRSTDPCGVLGEAMICYAGLAAERRASPERTVHHARDDLREFAELLPNPAMQKTVITRVEWTIAARWDDVERLAGELERRNGLYTEELKALGYWWPAPVRNSSLIRTLGIGS